MLPTIKMSKQKVKSVNARVHEEVQALSPRNASELFASKSVSSIKETLKEK